MIECAFASQTERGTKCRYVNQPCWGDDGFDCELMKKAVARFEELLNNMREIHWTEEFMENVVRKYGGSDDCTQ